MTVSAGDDGCVVGGFCPPLNLDAVNARVHQILQVVNGAHIPGIEDISTLFILVDREILPGPLFLHEGILIAAGLGTGTPVAVSAGHVVAQQTPAGVADAHSAVTKGLDLQFFWGFCPDFRNFLQMQLSCQNHPFGTQVIPGVGTFVVGNGLLGGDVTLTFGGVFARQHESTQIGNDQRVHPRVLELFQISGELGNFLVAGHGVDGHMDFHTMAVGVFHSFWHLLRGEVTGKGTHSKIRAGQIHRVRTVKHGHFQPFHIPGGA